jgi:transposase
LKGIRKSLDKFSKKQKGLHNKWAFYDLRCKIEYKAQMLGIPVIVVDPRYSSQMCNSCKHMGNRKSKSFKCINCGLETDADVNAAKNLAIMGSIVNTPENSTLLSCELGLNSLVGFSRI